jgi:hypothetical protein
MYGSCTVHRVVINIHGRLVGKSGMEEARFRDPDFQEIRVIILISNDFVLFTIHPNDITVRCWSAVHMVANFRVSSKLGDNGLAR